MAKSNKPPQNSSSFSITGERDLHALPHTRMLLIPPMKQSKAQSGITARQKQTQKLSEESHKNATHREDQQSVCLSLSPLSVVGSSIQAEQPNPLAEGPIPL